MPQNDAEVKVEDVTPVTDDAAIMLEAKDKEIDMPVSEVMEDQATIEQSDKAYCTEFPSIPVSSMEPPKVPLAIRKPLSTRRKGSDPVNKSDSKRQKSNEESK